MSAIENNLPGDLPPSSLTATPIGAAGNCDSCRWWDASTRVHISELGWVAPCRRWPTPAGLGIDGKCITAPWDWCGEWQGHPLRDPPPARTVTKRKGKQR